MRESNPQSKLPSLGRQCIVSYYELHQQFHLEEKYKEHIILT